MRVVDIETCEEIKPLEFHHGGEYTDSVKPVTSDHMAALTADEDAEALIRAGSD